MPADIKSILDSIIDGANNKFPNTVNSTMHQNMGVKAPETFDAGKFREKLSLYVLKDIITAMMHDETKDLDGMIDQSIINHIRDCYGCGCYDYLCKSRDKLNSPILSDIIQEIDQKTMQVQSKVVDRQDDAFTADAEDLKEGLKNVENYDELRKLLRETVSNKVVEDVANAVKDSTDAPEFKNLDDELEKRKASDEMPLEADDVTNESSILRMTGMIVSEGAAFGHQISTDDAMNAAIIEYCLCEMDFLFKQDITMEQHRAWDSGRKVITEGFFDIFKKKDVDKEDTDPSVLRESFVDAKNSEIVQEVSRSQMILAAGSLIGALAGGSILPVMGVPITAFGVILGAIWGHNIGALIATNRTDIERPKEIVRLIDAILKLLGEESDDLGKDVKALKKKCKNLYDELSRTIPINPNEAYPALKTATGHVIDELKSSKSVSNGPILKDFIEKALKVREILTGVKLDDEISKAAEDLSEDGSKND